MKKYKGRYVAQVNVDIEINNPEQEGILHLNEIKDNMMRGMVENAIADCLKEVFNSDKYASVSVARMYADIYEIDE